MRKTIYLLILLTTPSWSANVTQAQVKQAQKATQDLLTAVQAMTIYTNTVAGLINNNFTLNVPGSAFTITLDTTTQTEVIDLTRYNQFKTNLVNAFNELP